jgi:hypothetical protein
LGPVIRVLDEVLDGHCSRMLTEEDLEYGLLVVREVVWS